MTTKQALFVLGVFTDDARYLVVQERDGTWYLPAGRVEPGEDLLGALARETAEEAQQVCGVDGLLGFDHTATGRMRFVFAGKRSSLAPPKSIADHHTRAAAWLTREVIATLPLRDDEVLRWIDRRRAGAPLLPPSAYEWNG